MCPLDGLSSYFLIEFNGATYLLDTADLPPQFGRRVLARLAGIEDEWDWAVCTFIENMLETRRRLTRQLGSISWGA